MLSLGCFTVATDPEVCASCITSFESAQQEHQHNIVVSLNKNLIGPEKVVFVYTQVAMLLAARHWCRQACIVCMSGARHA